MTVLLENTTLPPHLTIVGLSGAYQYHRRNGSAGSMLSLTWRLISATKARVPDRSAMLADDEAAGKYRLPNASA
eukprot:776295-Amphidinium_carterae.1